MSRSARELRRRLGTALLCAVTAWGLTGCAGDDLARLPEPPQGSAQAPASLTVTATDFDFELSRNSVPTGLLDIELVNEGSTPHQVQLLQPQFGVSMRRLRRAVEEASDVTLSRRLAAPIGGVGALTGVPSGGRQTATVTVVPGKYLLVCFIDGHVGEGMLETIRVTQEQGASGALALATITMRDYEFALPDGFTGRGTFELVNKGKHAHEAALVRLEATLTEAEGFARAPAGGRFPGGDPDPAGGASAISSRRSEYLHLDLEPGTYAFICFLPDRQGRPHYERGMVAAFEVS